ncbi:MAG: hypothetical protein K8J31_24960, partial [Anaerolineae bacterium]|nr:hypothetical protein [Anaerolineae bacterium]
SLHLAAAPVHDIDGVIAFVQRLTERRTIDVSPAWSPDGRALVFSSVRSGRYEVDIYDLATGAGHAITTDQIPPRTPRWVGNRIVYASGTRIYAVNADGTDPRELADIGVEISALAVRP